MHNLAGGLQGTAQFTTGKSGCSETESNGYPESENLSPLVLVAFAMNLGYRRLRILARIRTLATESRV